MLWPDIPEDAIHWLRVVFAEANRRATERLINVPNIRESALDDRLVEALIPFSPPRLLPSGATVEMHIHNIGGLRSIRHWETADIAVLVFVYRSSHLMAQKIGLLQSKRLFPENNDVEADDPVGFAYGMNKFLRPDGASPLGKIHRQFDFNRDCSYSALRKDDQQTAAIEEFNDHFGESIYYLFYNPPLIPASVRYPVVSYQSISDPPLGCRVYTTTDVDAALATATKGKSPTLATLQDCHPASNWRLEHWIDLLLRCKVGQQFDGNSETQISQLLERRTGPIGAAIAVSIALPSDG